MRYFDEMLDLIIEGIDKTFFKSPDEAYQWYAGIWSKARDQEDPDQDFDLPPSLSACSQTDAKMVFSKLARKVHPDLHPDRPNAAKAMAKLNSAFALINKATNGQTGGGGGNKRKRVKFDDLKNGDTFFTKDGVRCVKTAFHTFRTERGKEVELPIFDVEQYEVLVEKKLTSKGRNQIKSGNFALPGRRYPIHDKSHARNALSRVSQNGTAAEKKKVRAAVHSKYPDIGDSE